MSDLIVDISNNNGTVDFANLCHAWPIKGVFAKASQGDYFTDKQFGRNRAEARRRGIPFGAYHFFDPKVDATRQAEHFVAVVQKLNPTDLKPALDFEQGGLSGEAAHAAIVAFNAIVKKELGRYPLFYSYSAFIDGLGLPLPVGDGLWLANYGADDGVEHPFTTPRPWRKTVLHQFTSKAHVLGKQFDLSYGNLHGCLAFPWRAKLIHNV